jgi:hypothetical protein
MAARLTCFELRSAWLGAEDELTALGRQRFRPPCDRLRTRAKKVFEQFAELFFVNRLEDDRDTFKPVHSAGKVASIVSRHNDDRRIATAIDSPCDLQSFKAPVKIDIEKRQRQMAVLRQVEWRPADLSSLSPPSRVWSRSL